MVLPATSLQRTYIHPDVSRHALLISKNSCFLKGTMALFMACTLGTRGCSLGATKSYSATPSAILAGEECK